MTIHSSKVLENDNVIIILETPYNINTEEFRNKLFVGITRAKKMFIFIWKKVFLEKHILET